MIAALEGGEWSAARPGRTLPPGKTRYPLYRGLDGPQGQSGRAENLAPPGFDPRTVQPVVSRYTVWATRPTSGYVCLSNLLYFLILYKFSARFVGPLKIIHENTNVFSTSVPAAFLELANFVFHLWPFFPWKTGHKWNNILCCTHLYGLCKCCYLELIFI